MSKKKQKIIAPDESNKVKKGRRKYDAADRLKVAVAWLATNSLRKAGQICGIPARACQRFAQEDTWHDVVEAARQQTAGTLTSAFNEIIDLATKETKARLVEGDPNVDRNGDVHYAPVKASVAASIALKFRQQIEATKGPEKAKEDAKQDLEAKMKEMEELGRKENPIADVGETSDETKQRIRERELALVDSGIQPGEMGLKNWVPPKGCTGN